MCVCARACVCVCVFVHQGLRITYSLACSLFEQFGRYGFALFGAHPCAEPISALLLEKKSNFFFRYSHTILLSVASCEQMCS